MPEITTTEPVSLMQLRGGESFSFNSKIYVLLEHGRTRSTIATVGEGKISIYKLSMNAKVKRAGRDDAGYRLALAEWRPPIQFTPGDMVRVITSDRTLNRKIAGAQSVVVRVNSKSVSLANGWRIHPALLEKV